MDQGIRRRDFFKVLGASGAVAASTAACADVPEKLIPYLLPPSSVEFAPGQPLEYATTCLECPAGCGMVVKTREGRAIKAEGNPDHPISQGALCVRGQAGLQTHYNPARLSKAAQRTGQRFEPLEWAQAEALLVQKIKAVADRRQIVYLTGNAAGTRGKFLDAWLAAIGASPKLVLDPLSLHNLRAANDKVFKRAEVPLYRIAEADLLVNFGSEFLETWISPVANNREFAAMHAYNAQTKRKGKLVHVGPHVSLSGANADEWLPVSPGTEGMLALALARIALEARRAKLPAAEVQRLEALTKQYTPEWVAHGTGAKAEAIKKLGEELANASAPLALAGGNALASQEGVATIAAVNVLNYILGAVGKTMLFGAGVQADLSTPYSKVLEAVQRMQAGQVKLLIVDGANPVYSLPKAAQVAEALAKVETIVSLSPAWDETSVLAHLVLPGLAPLERWGDVAPVHGVNSLVQPVMAPFYPLKAAEDTLLAVAQGIGLGTFKSSRTYRDYLRTAWSAIHKETGGKGDFESFWRDSLQRGGVFGKPAASAPVRLNLEGLAGLASLAAPAPLAGEGLALLPTASLRHRDGRGASNPWLQEIPDPISQVIWDSWADINPRTAKKMGIAHGDLIRITSPQGSVEVAAYLHYGVHDGAVAIPLGGGHTKSGKAADGYGVNVMSLLPSAFDKASGELAYLSTRVKVERTGKTAYLAQVEGSPRQMGREIIQTMSVQEVHAGKEPQHEIADKEREGLPSFYPPRDVQTPGYHHPYRWGMAVDVDRCTGCSACVAACYAENNIAVVGKARSALGRHMAWLRIDRYIEGEGDTYQTLLQPFMCQQCSNAGCESVCPVYATYHNPDGLNAQIYNRCVGTRYCSNNCPYKARRFNWFEYDVEAPLHMQLNPDVTVRTKGVMEKCTFCVQRIQRGKMAAHTQGREARDGEITPACVQTCPTHALTFGNLADPGSAVSKQALRGEESMKSRVRQYEVLEELRQLPAVTYLRKVTLSQREES